MRLSAIAEKIARIDGVDPDETHARLRNPMFKSLLVSEPGRTRNSPASYEPQEVLRARLLLACADCGLSTSELEIVNRALTEPPIHDASHPPSAAGKGYGSGLHCIVRGTEAGEGWSLRIRFARQNDGKRRASANVFWEGWTTADKRASRAVDLLNVETHIGTLEIPASDLVAPLLECK